MPSLVITRDTVSVRLQSDRLELIRHAEAGMESLDRFSVPLHDVERVVICGRPIVTLPVLHRLMSLRIPVTFLSARGRWLGAIAASGSIGFSRKRGCGQPCQLA